VGPRMVIRVGYIRTSLALKRLCQARGPACTCKGQQPETQWQVYIGGCQLTCLLFNRQLLLVFEG
jgi:hypothetical protein